MRDEVFISTASAMHRIDERVLRRVQGTVVPPHLAIFQQSFAGLEASVQYSIEAISFVLGELNAFTDGIILARAM